MKDVLVVAAYLRGAFFARASSLASRPVQPSQHAEAGI